MIYEDNEMFKISAHICNELKNSNLILNKLEEKERENILCLVLKKYIDSSFESEWLWEKFIRYEFLNDNMAWSYMKKYIKDNECILFFNQSEEKEMFLVKSGDDLNHILSETYGYEFYVTNRACTYLLCFNHHDTLFGCGNAEKWIKDMKGF